MIILTGNSLSKRQQELNSKVNAATASKKSVEDITLRTNKTDIDVFFNIDLASKYENIEYMIEILKSGDSLHITRALKSIWLYDDKHSNVINPDYLHSKIFPMMSLKLKRYLLTIISTHVKEESRAYNFYTYSISEGLPEIAFKFLINASEETKLQFLENGNSSFDLMLADKNDKYLLHFIGSSFTLADAYLETVYKSCSNLALYSIRHLYSVSDVKFLDLIDNYGHSCSSHYRKYQLGLRASKHIMEKHKDRVLKNPLVYLQMLNKSILVKHSTSDDVKQYLVALLPTVYSAFWDESFCDKYKYLIDLIPLEDRFQFVKKIFTDSYPGIEFEMTLRFYELKYFNLMTAQEREAWALKHIQSQKEILGNRNDYIWYTFVNFTNAFAEIKKQITITPGKDRRCDMLKVLIESAKTHQDLAKLFNHYYQRHVNEETYYKHTFLKEVMDKHNILDFDEECWMAYDKLLCSEDLYSSSCSSYYNENFKVVVLLYHILHRKDVPEVLNRILDYRNYNYAFKPYLKRLDDERKDMVYQYIIQYYLKKFNQFNEELSNKVNAQIDLVLELFQLFEKTKIDCPEIVMKFVDLLKENYRHNAFFYEQNQSVKLTQEHCIRHLKEDTELVLKDLPQLKKILENEHRFQLNKFLKKLKIYFPNDVAKNFLDFFINLLADNDTFLSYFKKKSCVHGIFQLGDTSFLNDFMMKYVPTDSKVDHRTKDQHLVHTQEFICRFACYSRPPVPLSNMLMYIKGDYVRFCLPMFNMYLAKLPLPQCLEFIEAILDAPLSIQKHGIRMAFGCFDTENLNKLVLRVWKKTKNVSLRKIVYSALYNKILQEKETAQELLFNVLKVLTNDLHEDDDDEVFSLLTSNGLPQGYICDFLEAGWIAVNKFRDNGTNLVRKTKIINHMANHIDILRKASIKPIVDDHIKTMLIDEQIRDSYEKFELTDLNKAKWNLVTIYLMNVKSEDDLEDNLILLKSITKRCFEMWNVYHSYLYTIRHFYPTFINDLQSQAQRGDRIESEKYSIIIFETLLRDLEESLPIHRSYLHIWNLRLTITSLNVLKTGRSKNTKDCIHDFTRQLGNLTKEFVEKDLFFKTMFDSIKRQVEENLKTLYNAMSNNRTDGLEWDDAKVIAASDLLEFEIPETYLLALHLLPLNYNSERQDEDYVPAIKKIKASKNTEIQCSMYEKFVNSDFKYRDFMES